MTILDMNNKINPDMLNDIHKEHAAQIFNKDISEVTYAERRVAKTVQLLKHYGASKKAVVKVLKEDSTNFRLINYAELEKRLTAFMLKNKRSNYV